MLPVPKSVSCQITPPEGPVPQRSYDPFHSFSLPIRYSFLDAKSSAALHNYTMPSAKSDTPGTDICDFYHPADLTIPPLPAPCAYHCLPGHSCDASSHTLFIALTLCYKQPLATNTITIMIIRQPQPVPAPSPSISNDIQNMFYPPLKLYCISAYFTLNAPG